MDEPTAGAGERKAVKRKRPALTRAKIRSFLDHLAATCHVKGAAAAAGASIDSVYRRRRSDPAFAQAWHAAIQAGYERLEEELLARALREVGSYRIDEAAVTLELDDGRDAASPGSEAPSNSGVLPRAGSGGVKTGLGLNGKVARMDVQLALMLLNRRTAMATNGRDRHGRRRPTAEEVEKTLSAKLDTLSRRLAAPDA